MTVSYSESRSAYLDNIIDELPSDQRIFEIIMQMRTRTDSASLTESLAQIYGVGLIGFASRAKLHW